MNQRSYNIHERHNILGVIPARGGSEGIPRKNIRALAGKPLLYYSVAAAKDSALLAGLCVSTDDPEIADVAESLGVRTPFMRPSELSTSTASSVEVVLHALHYYDSVGQQFDGVCLIQPTCPLRPCGVIDYAIKLWTKAHSDGVISVLPVPHSVNPYWVMFERDGCLEPALQGSPPVTRRQDLPPAYQRSGCLYLAARTVLEEQRSFFAGRMVPLIGCAEHHVNLDNVLDWEHAENLFAKLESFQSCCGKHYD